MHQHKPHFTIELGQHTGVIKKPSLKDIVSAVESINPNKKNPYIVLHTDNGNYIQALRSSTGFLVECRYFIDRDWNNFTHYRTWNTHHHNDLGKVNPLSGEWGPWVHEHEHINIDLAISLLFQFTHLRNQLPKAPHIRWRDITDDFPYVTTQTTSLTNQ